MNGLREPASTLDIDQVPATKQHYFRLQMTAKYSQPYIIMSFCLTDAQLISAFHEPKLWLKINLL